MRNRLHTEFMAIQSKLVTKRAFRHQFERFEAKLIKRKSQFNRRMMIFEAELQKSTT